MAVVRYVGFWPPTGFRRRPWLDDPACDSLVKSGRRVAESYSRAVAGHGLGARTSEVRVFLHPAPPGQDAVAISHLDPADLSAAVLVPASVGDLGPGDRAALALDVLQAVMERCAATRGWPAEVLSTVAAEVRDAGYGFVWAGPWKAGPDRRREARGLFWLEDDAFGRTVIEVRDRGRTEAPVRRSQEAGAFCTAAGFARSARTLRWAGSAEVTMTPSIDLVGAGTTALRFRPDLEAGDHPGPMPPPAPSGAPRPPVVDEPRPTHEIRFIGGGPTNEVPSAYLEVLRVLLHRLERLAAPWWSGADRPLLEISWFVRDGPRRVRVRRLATRVTAVVERNLASFAGADPEALARRDVVDLVEAVRRRMGLGVPAELDAVLGPVGAAERPGSDPETT